MKNVIAEKRLLKMAIVAVEYQKILLALNLAAAMEILTMAKL